MKKILIFLLMALFLLSSCSSGNNKENSQENNQESSNTILIENFEFSPEQLEIPINAKITWIQKDSAPHDVTSINNEFKSPILNKDEEFSYTFTKAGDYNYYCRIHPSMKGKIIVKNV